MDKYKIRISQGEIYDVSDGVFTIIWKGTEILLVAKDSDYTQYFTTVLDELGYSYEVKSSDVLTKVENQEGKKEVINPQSIVQVTNVDELLNYPIVIWMTGDLYINTITSREQEILKKYLEEEGRLFITGQDIGYDLVVLNRGAEFYSQQYIV